MTGPGLGEELSLILVSSSSDMSTSVTNVSMRVSTDN